MTTQIITNEHLSKIITDESLLKCILSFDDEAIVYYQGDTNDGEFNGYGKVLSSNFNYHGMFENGKFHGKGTLTFNKKCFDDEPNNFLVNAITRYEGNFSNGRFDGDGRAEFYNSEFYIGKFKDNCKHGVGTKYNNNGKVVFSKSVWDMNYLTDRKEIALFHDNGNIKYKGEFNGVTKEGNGTLYDKNKNPIYMGMFKDDKYNGKGTLYQNNEMKKPGSKTEIKLGMVLCEGLFKDGHLSHGSIYNTIGYKVFEGKLNDENVAIGKGKLFKNNKLYYEGIFDDKSTVNKSIDTSFDNNYGKLKYSFKNGTIYMNGNKTFINYAEGKENGEKITYKGESEEILSKYQMKNGTKDGEFTEYNNGKIIKKGIYKDGKLHGECEFFKDDISISKCVYKNGKKEEGTIYFENSDNPKYTGKFDSSENYTGTGTLYYDIPNAIHYQGGFMDGLYHGTGTLYYKNGNKQYEGQFQHNLCNGTGISFYESTGNAEYSGNWINNKKHGEGTLMDEDGIPILLGNWVDDALQQ